MHAHTQLLLCARREGREDRGAKEEGGKDTRGKDKSIEDERGGREE
jgi:hypothetical protein